MVKTKIEGDKNLKFYSNEELPKPTETRLQYLREQVCRLMEIPQPEQRSAEWYEFRDSMLTASDWGTILGMNPYSNSNSLLLKKCGKDVPFPSNAAIDWGVKYEEVAVKIYERRNEVEILEFGCIRHPTIDYLGASPDGISRDGIMLEIKCPSKREITGVIPKYYWCQVQAQLEVCELDRCDFLECNLKEYEGGQEEYLNDNFNGDYTKNSYGMEKGVLLTFYNKITKKNNFCYGPLCLGSKELIEEWIVENKERFLEENPDCLFMCVDYWYLMEISCIPIYRNQEWFHEALIPLTEFWKSILYWRSEGYEKLDEKLKLEKEEKRKNKKPKNETIFFDSNINDFMEEDDPVKIALKNRKSLFSKLPPPPPSTNEKTPSPPLTPKESNTPNFRKKLFSK